MGNYFPKPNKLKKKFFRILVKGKNVCVTINNV